MSIRRLPPVDAAAIPQHRRNAEARQIALAGLLMQDDEQVDDEQVDDGQIEVVPITVPPSAWESLPLECRVRMFEFESIQAEYQESYATQPPRDERDRSAKLDFDDIAELALLNSREYQTQKERLYRVALRLSLERYDYQLKFSPFGSGTGVIFSTRQATDESLSQLRVPSAAGTEKMLSTGSKLVSRFANQVLLTFNGPDGFAVDVGSELLLELRHSVFQNDASFERLTQAERDVVYAARDFARFRRTFYGQLAAQYYGLLRTYRLVEIDALNYLSLVRVYSQRDVEFGEGQIARVQIDQLEQNALAGRSRLISTCNTLEDALDALKIRLGLPTETGINIDLTELYELTLRDELSVSVELIGRVRSRLIAEMSREDRDQASVLNVAAELVARMRDSLLLSEKLAGSNSRNVDAEPDDYRGSSLDELDRLQARLRVSEFRFVADRIRERIEVERANPATPPFRLPELTAEFGRAVSNLIPEERNWALTLGADRASLDPLESVYRQLDVNLGRLESLTEEILATVAVERIEELDQQATSVVSLADSAVRLARKMLQDLAVANKPPPADLVSRLLEDSQLIIDDAGVGLTPVSLAPDPTVLAALHGRLDLMNARGELADQWRGIKLAADDVKSILDLRARQLLTTENQSNRAIEFNFDESDTELSVTLDTPLNRRAQRNAFREQLLNYQLSRRSVMAVEDAIKQDVRGNLRSLRLAEEQYAVGVASAALAYERVITTELQLRLGVAGVTARDFLEAQTAYTTALSTVASRRIGHIIDRINLFVNLEQLQLDEFGRWPDLRDGSRFPSVDVIPFGPPNYGTLPNVRYSRELLDGLKERQSSE